MSMAEPLSVESRVEEIATEAFWKANFPGLTIGARLAQGNLPQIEPAPAELGLWRERMAEEAYFSGAADTLARLTPRLGEAVATCKALDIPPAFIFLFDETWECFYALSPMLKAFLGDGYLILPDFWTWFIDPKALEAGWRPHRDKGYRSLAADRSPLSLTVWIPLSESAPQNGCMYILPANADPVYGTASDKAWQIDLGKVRAMPAKPGEFLCWNQAVLHWGGQSSRFAETPRMSMALEFQRGDIAPFNSPMIRPFANLEFALRLQLVAKQILQYKHMYPLAARFETMARRLLGA